MNKRSNFYIGLLFGGSICLNAFLWITLFQRKHVYLQNPFVVLGLCILSVIYAIGSLILVARKKNKKATIFMVFVVLVILYSNYIFFQIRQGSGFYEYAAKCIEREYHLTDVKWLGGDIPADVYFVVDDDGSVDLTEIQNYYGHKYIYMLQGTIKNGENEGRKLLVLFESRTLNPMTKVTVLELDSSYDTLIVSREQGYDLIEEGHCSYDVFPIVSVLKEPKSDK